MKRKMLICSITCFAFFANSAFGADEGLGAQAKATETEAVKAIEFAKAAEAAAEKTVEAAKM